MDANDKSFRQNFETLLALFKKLADKMSEGEIQGMNPEFANQFRMMLSQYEMMKHMMPHNIPEQFREPFRQMMENMIHQLKVEVGDEMIFNPEQKELVEEEEQTIEEIEKLLGRPGLNPAEMDKLLDKLVELKSKSNKG
jgi:hypothetical protein